MTVTVNVHDAKTHLSQLLNRVLAGEEVIIAKAGKPVARLVPVLPERVRALMTSIEYQLFFSSVSAWEVATKVDLGKLRLPSGLDSFLT